MRNYLKFKRNLTTRTKARSSMDRGPNLDMGPLRSWKNWPGRNFWGNWFPNFLRERVLGPLGLWVHQKPVRGVRRIEQYLPDFAQRLQRTIPSYSKRSCFEALHACIEIYRDLRSRYSAGRFMANEDAERESLAYLAKLLYDLERYDGVGEIGWSKLPVFDGKKQSK